MSESESPKKRRFWRIHLSTAVLVMLEIGVLLYLNMAGWRGVLATQKLIVNFHDEDSMYRSTEELKRIDTESALGWPFRFFILPDMMISGSFMQGGLTGRYALFGDVATSALLSGFTAFLSEYLIRRREARKS